MKTRQSGVAIISVLLTVVLATIIVSGLFLREHITVRSVQNRISLTQTRWVERAAIDWSKVILGADLRSRDGGGQYDHLGEPWAVPVAETRLDETVTAGAKIDDDSRAATLSGDMSDAQGRLNLNNLVIEDKEGVISKSESDVKAFGALLDSLGLPGSLADTLVARLLASTPSTPKPDSPVPGAVSTEPDLPTALPLLRTGDLIAVRGFDAGVVEALEPFVTFLPQRTTINVNTAPAEVLAAAVDGLELGVAKQMVTNRERKFYRNLSDFKEAITPVPENFQEAGLSVKSDFFLVRGLIRFGRVQSFSETLLHREQRRVSVIWQRRL